MNFLDLVLMAAMGGAAYAGFRLGFIARALSWAGLVVGVTVAVLLVDDLVGALDDEPARSRLIAALAFVFVLATLGQVIGFAAGTALRRRLPAQPGLHTSDRVGGAAMGAIGVLIGVWLLVPALTSAPGWPARAARDSQIVRFVDRVAPAPPAASVTLGRLVGEAPFPEVFDAFEGPTNVGPAPTGGLAPDVSARVEQSVVKVEGQACDQIQNGSGFVIADDIVVTNAHVVAGERDTAVQTDDGELDATVIAFDADRDLAVLHVDGLEANPLTRAEAATGDTGAVYGHPGGGALRAAPARIADVVTARGTDIYRTGETDRSVFVLAAALAPGDSGGPLVDQQGRVVGVAFAIDPGEAGTAYALTGEELDATVDPVLASGSEASVDTGPCLVG